MAPQEYPSGPCFQVGFAFLGCGMILKHNVCLELPWTITVCIIIACGLVMFFDAAFKVIGKTNVESVFSFEAFQDVNVVHN